MLRRHSREYNVRVGHPPPVDPDRHHFGREGIGHHLLLMQPNVVGGYVSQNGRRYLRVVCDDRTAARARSIYESIKAGTIAFDPNWSETEMRRAWLEQEKVGRWDPNWKDVKDRTAIYFDKYDMHIRCWIPHYESFIAHTASITAREIARVFQLTNRNVRVLEVGFGTGELTIHLLNWIEHFNHPFAKLSDRPPVERYVGVDRAPQMIELLKARIGKHFSSGICKFEEGTAWDGLPLALEDEKFDVICGSLVLHDLLGPNPSETLQTMVARCAQLLSREGSMIFADSLVSARNPERDREI